jgi:hypothetical protein
MTARGTSTFAMTSKLDQRAHYSTHSVRLTTFMVQLVTIKVTPDRLHADYQLQKNFNE